MSLCVQRFVNVLEVGIVVTLANHTKFLLAHQPGMRLHFTLDVLQTVLDQRHLHLSRVIIMGHDTKVSVFFSKRTRPRFVARD